MAVIGISGSYGGLNVGDEAILTCALRELRQVVPDAEVVVFSRNAEHTQAHHAADRVVAVRGPRRDRPGDPAARPASARRRRPAL